MKMPEGIFLTRRGDGKYLVSCAACYCADSFRNPRAQFDRHYQAKQWIRDHQHELTLEHALVRAIVSFAWHRNSRVFLFHRLKQAGWVRGEPGKGIGQIHPYLILYKYSNSNDPEVQAKALIASILANDLNKMKVGGS